MRTGKHDGNGLCPYGMVSQTDMQACIREQRVHKQRHKGGGYPGVIGIGRALGAMKPRV